MGFRGVGLRVSGFGCRGLTWLPAPCELGGGVLRVAAARPVDDATCAWGWGGQAGQGGDFRFPVSGLRVSGVELKF